jgi:hypothetical protein
MALYPRGLIPWYPLCKRLGGPQTVLDAWERRKRPVLGTEPRFPCHRAGKYSRTNRRVSLAKGKFGLGCQIVLFIWMRACVGASSLASSALLARSALLPLTIPDPHDRRPAFKVRCAGGTAVIQSVKTRNVKLYSKLVGHCICRRRIRNLVCTSGVEISVIHNFTKHRSYCVWYRNGCFKMYTGK